MEEQYSSIVYRDKGPHQRPNGTYDFRGVNSKAEHAAALKDGWFNSMPEAIEGKHSVVDLPENDSPPTREELEQKAKELGIKFDKKTSNETLTDKINKAMGA